MNLSHDRDTETYEYYKKAQASYWTVEEIDLTQDLRDWEKLTGKFDDERTHLGGRGMRMRPTSHQNVIMTSRIFECVNWLRNLCTRDEFTRVVFKSISLVQNPRGTSSCMFSPFLRHPMGLCSKIWRQGSCKVRILSPHMATAC